MQSYQDFRSGHAFAGSYQSVKRYVHRVRQTHPEVWQRTRVRPGEEVQVNFGTVPTLASARMVDPFLLRSGSFPNGGSTEKFVRTTPDPKYSQ
jgi:hypothetical protein